MGRGADPSHIEGVGGVVAVDGVFLGENPCVGHHSVSNPMGTRGDTRVWGAVDTE